MMRPILFALLSVSCAWAQPPNVIRLVRQGTIPYAPGQAPVNVIAMSVIAGPAENWLIEMHDSFASLEKVDRMQRAAVPSDTRDSTAFPDLLSQSRMLIASYRPELSHRADEGAQLFPKMRYLDFAIIRIRLGAEADLAKLLKLRIFSLDSVNADRPEIAYQVVSGAPSGTYVVLAPMTSLGTLDSGRADTPAYAAGAQDAAKKIAADTELLREHVWMRIEPRTSKVSDEFAAQDYSFWRAN
jgi:hypothetical protein